MISVIKNESLERAFVATFFYNPAESKHILNMISEEDFTNPNYRKFIKWLKETEMKEIPDNTLIYAQEIERRFGKTVLTEILLVKDYEMLTKSSIEGAVRFLKEMTAKRKAVGITKTVNNIEKKEVKEVINELESQLTDISKDLTPFQKTKTLSDIIFTLSEHIEHLRKNDSYVTGLSSGFSELDKATAGFHPGELIVVGARPAMGKTGWALNVAKYLSVDNQIPGGFISLEMSADQIIMRLLSLMSGIKIRKIRSGSLTDEEFDQLNDVAVELIPKPLYIDDSSSVDIADVRGIAKRMKIEYDIQYLIVDYLQLVNGTSKKNSRNDEIAEVSRGLKAIAKDLEIPVIALAQLSRQVEIRADKRPILADLRESGQIEADSDLVMFLHRPAYYKKNPGPEELNLAELIIAKQRNGATGTINLFFDGSTVKFGNWQTHSNENENEDVPF